MGNADEDALGFAVGAGEVEGVEGVAGVGGGEYGGVGAAGDVGGWGFWGVRVGCRRVGRGDWGCPLFFLGVCLRWGF